MSGSGQYAAPVRSDSARHAYLDHPHPLAIAHRGGTEAAAENTVAAFAAALAEGFRYLETDVHVSADGVLLAFHDDELDRVTDGSGRVAELPWSEIAAARIAGTESIPTLDELLETFPTARFNIDAKSDHAVVALASSLRRHAALDRVCVGAFSDRRLRRLRTLLGPEACTTAGPRETAGLLTAARRGRPARRSPAYHCLQVPVRQGRITVTDHRFVDAAHARGCAVHVWTIDDPDEMHRLFDLGVDGIFTDRPSILRSVLEARGEWA